MTARQQLARPLPLVLLIVLAMAGLRGDGVAIGLVLEVVLGVLVITRRRESTARRMDPDGPAESDNGRRDVPGALRLVLTWVLSGGMVAVAVVLLTNLRLHFFTKLPARPPLRPPSRTRPR